MLAYAYDLASIVGPRLTLRVYDPNRPKDDRVTLSLDLSDPARWTPVVPGRLDGVRVLPGAVRRADASLILP